MIQEVKMYTVVCDNCGESADSNGDYSCWTCEETAWCQAEGSDYIKHEGKHYCPKCFDFDDEDNLTLKLIPLKAG